MASRLSATLRVRVEEARGLLPLAEAAEGDAPLLVTLRLAPGETKHSARTRAVRRGLEPVRSLAASKPRAVLRAAMRSPSLCRCVGSG